MPVKNTVLKNLHTRSEALAKEHENLLTLHLIREHGAERVRGGDYIMSFPDERELNIWRKDAAAAKYKKAPKAKKKQKTFTIDL